MAPASSADTERDAQAILQLLLDAPQLSQYYHFDQRPDRLPLALVNRSGADIGQPGLTVQKQAVVISSSPSDKAVEITTLRIGADTANLEFAFRVEGVRGTAGFRKSQGNWTLDKLSVAER